MFFVQMMLFQSDKCYVEVPLIYFWLVAQIMLFYFIVAYGLAMWGSYLCWYAEHKDEILKKKMKEYVKKQMLSHISPTKKQIKVPLLKA